MESKILKTRKSQFSVAEVALATFLFVLYNILFIELYSLFPRSFRANEIIALFASFVMESLFAVAAWTTAVSKRVNIVQAAGLNKKINWKIVLYGFFISLVCIVGFGNITNVFLEFLTLLGYKQQLSSMVIDTFWKYLLYAIVFCVTPAFCEELLFRGAILSGLKQYGTKFAIVCSSIIFTLMHGNAEQTIHQFIIGVVVGYLFVKSENLWLGVIVHFFNNFITVTTSFVLALVSKGGGNVAAETSDLNPWTQLLFSALFAVAFAYFAWEILKYLLRNIFDEDKRINEKVQANAVISVDGAEVQTTMEIDGVAQNETVSNDVEQVSGDVKKDKTEQLSVGTIVMFTLSCSYLVLEWVLSLIAGFGVF